MLIIYKLFKFLFNYLFKFILKGDDYTQGVDSDVLLLDVSNNDEYMWTIIFSPTINYATFISVIIK